MIYHSPNRPVAIMKRILALLFTLLTISASQAQKPGKIVGGKNYTGVLLPVETKLPPHEAAPRWMPTADDIRMLEQDLVGFMREQPKTSPVNRTAFGPSIRRRLGRYRRQYAGYLSPEGKQIIYVNCFWPSPNRTFGQRWQSQLVQVLDGGSSFWQICYNPKTRTFLAFSVNGVA